jgi:DNA invertase Pin-like site-specific DNA recombinase
MMRFAFYGRVSTEDQQDPESSRNWQLARSRTVIELAGGEIVDEFFDIGESRALPWSRRRHASRLLATFPNPARGFEAVVIGEPQRAFCGNQFGLTFPVFTHYGVELWVPEVGGRIDPDSEAHDIVMNLFGGMSKAERTRIKMRVRTAMAAQVAIEGRFQGGRPPYGYKIADAGPHPNPGKAAIGQRLHKLKPDLIAAPIVRRIYDEYLTGAGLQAIATGLTRDGIPCPSAHDPGRNSHRLERDGSWAKSAIRAILENPRYAGHQVWNKQRKDEVLIDVEDVALGHENKMRWNDKADWIWSPDIVQEPIVSMEVFEAAQAMFDATKRTARRTPTKGRTYLFAGMMWCAVCGKRMQGHWTHDRSYYRCKPTTDRAADAEPHPKNIYVKESDITPGIDHWLATLFDDEHLDQTAEVFAGSSKPDGETEARNHAIRDQISDCDRRLARYRLALDAEGEVATVAGWIAEVERERKALQAQLGRDVEGGKLTKSQVRFLVHALRDIVSVLAYADPNDKAELYKELGVGLVYHPDGRVAIEVLPRGVQVRVGGGSRTVRTLILRAVLQLA